MKENILRQVDIHPEKTGFQENKYPVCPINRRKEHKQLRKLVKKDALQLLVDPNNPNYIDWNDEELLENLVLLYDKYFFEGEFMKNVYNSGYTINFEWSDELGRAAAATSFDMDRTFDVQMSKNVIEYVFSKNQKQHVGNGNTCRDRLECIMDVLEHEMIHIIMNLCGELIVGHTKEFVTYVNNCFGHTSITHSFYLN